MEFKPITIEITDVNKPPVIRVDGVKVPVVEFEHVYDTRTAYHEGTHRYLLRYIEDNRVKAIGYERPDDDIMRHQCAKCGSHDVNSDELYAGREVVFSSVKCKSCGHEQTGKTVGREAAQEDFDRKHW